MGPKMEILYKKQRLFMGDKMLEWKKVTRKIRTGCSVEELAIYILKKDPYFPVDLLIERGYISEFPYSTEVLVEIRKRWYTIRNRDAISKFRTILEEVTCIIPNTTEN